MQEFVSSVLEVIRQSKGKHCLTGSIDLFAQDKKISSGHDLQQPIIEYTEEVPPHISHIVNNL